MKKFFKRTLIVFLVLAGLAALWWWNYPINSMRYRLTVEVEADGKVHTGTSVLELGVMLVPAPLPEMRNFILGVRGEAVTVNLGSRGTLFLLLLGTRWQRDKYGSGEPETVPTRELGLRVAKASEIRGLHLLRSGPIEIPFDHLNRFMLVRFQDSSDPATLELVDPDNLAEAFGSGVRLRRIVIETTRDPVTWGNLERFPWIGTPGGPRRPESKRFDPMQRDLAYYLSASSFVRGEGK